jgi:hypothetical protein
MTRHTIISFDDGWVDARTGWMTGALPLMETVQSGHALVGLYTTVNKDGLSTQLHNFTIQPNVISQELPGDKVAVIQHHEVKIYTRRNGNEQWVETWGRYMEGIRLLWVKEAAMTSQKMTINARLMPTTQKAFFSKMIRVIRSLHLHTTEGNNLVELFDQAMDALDLKSHKLTIVMKRPFNQLTAGQVEYATSVSKLFTAGTVNQQTRLVSREELRDTVTTMAILFAYAIDVLKEPVRGEESNMQQDLTAHDQTLEWVRMVVRNIYTPSDEYKKFPESP